MTIQKIFADVKSGRKKKIILDCDAGNEMDDQYAIAYALGCENVEVLSINATLFLNTAKVPDFEAGMKKSYYEIERVLEHTGRTDLPLYYGCPTPIITEPELRGVDSEAVQNIIKTAHAADETIYVVATGAVTNVVSALLIDPSIKDKICVLWVGSNCITAGGAGEFNLAQDFAAGQYLYNCGVDLIIAPACGPKGEGTQELMGYTATLNEAFKGDSAANVFFRETLPAECDPAYTENPAEWWHIFWDVAGVSILDIPDTCELEIINAPRIRGDGSYALDEPRHSIVYMHRLDPKPILDRCFECINKVIK